MGSKRVGLARTQKLIENLKRELAMGGATFKDANVEELRGVVMCAYSAEVSTDGTGGFGDTTGITIPANSVITTLGVVVTTQLTRSTTATVGVNFGTAADGHELNVVDATSLAASGGGTIAVGKGTSTLGTEWTALGGNAAIVFDPNVAFDADARTIYGSVTVSAGNLTAGGVKFWVKYIDIS